MLINALRILGTAASLSAMFLLEAHLYWWRCAVQGLLAFKQSVQDPAGVLESWNPSILPDPCSSANCSTNVSTQDCNWAGIACQNWEIVALVAPCTTLPDGRDIGCALLGSPLDILTQVGQARWHYCLVLANRYGHGFSDELTEVLWLQLRHRLQTHSHTHTHLLMYKLIHSSSRGHCCSVCGRQT